MSVGCGEVEVERMGRVANSTTKQLSRFSSGSTRVTWASGMLLNRGDSWLEQGNDERIEMLGRVQLGIPLYCGGESPEPAV